MPHDLFAQARAVKDRHEMSILAGGLGVKVQAVGLTEVGGQPAISLTLAPDSPDLTLGFLEGVPLVTQRSGAIRAQEEDT